MTRRELGDITRRIALGVLTASVAMLAGCGQPTEIVLVARSDDPALRSVEISISDASGSTVTARRCVCVDGGCQAGQVQDGVDAAWPLTVGLRPGRDPAQPFMLRLRGHDEPGCGGMPRSEQQARVRFSPGRRNLLSMALYAACRGVSCDAETTCDVSDTGGLARCVPAERGELPPFTAPGGSGPAPDLGGALVDAGVAVDLSSADLSSGPHLLRLGNGSVPAAAWDGARYQVVWSTSPTSLARVQLSADGSMSATQAVSLTGSLGTFTGMALAAADPAGLGLLVAIHPETSTVRLLRISPALGGGVSFEVQLPGLSASEPRCSAAGTRQVCAWVETRFNVSIGPRRALAFVTAISTDPLLPSSAQTLYFVSPSATLVDHDVFIEGDSALFPYSLASLAGDVVSVASYSFPGGVIVPDRVLSEVGSAHLAGVVGAPAESAIWLARPSNAIPTLRRWVPPDPSTTEVVQLPATLSRLVATALPGGTRVAMVDEQGGLSAADVQGTVAGPVLPLSTTDTSAVGRPQLVGDGLGHSLLVWQHNGATTGSPEIWAAIW